MYGIYLTPTDFCLCVFFPRRAKNTHKNILPQAKGFVNRAGTRYNSAGFFFVPGRRAVIGG
jgi:hypothetical protein